jgi:hypothetical protein
MDLFELGKQHFVLLVDHWSGFFENHQELTRTTADEIILACKVQFARHGIPDSVIIIIRIMGPSFLSQNFQHLHENGSSSILRQVPVTHNPVAEQRTQSKLERR